MANAYTQLYIQLVYAVKHRDRLIQSSFKDELLKYTTGIIQNKGNKLLAINSMPDHVHLFFCLHPAISISDLVRDVKKHSTDFINDKKWLRGKFNWQEGSVHFHIRIHKLIEW